MNANPNLEYTSLDLAFDFFNARLFEGTLPKAFLMLRNHSRARGYFRSKAFSSRLNQEVTTDEISLCMETFGRRTDKEILSTLCHEQTHLLQAHFGKPGRRGYHNLEWAMMMIEIGLMPTDTGAVGGKMTGERVTHYIVEGGKFDLAATELLETGRRLNWQEIDRTVLATSLVGGVLAVAQQKQTRKKYTCPGCAMNAWAKFSAALVCGNCTLPMV